ncbi:cupredoxin domain-containing protein [Candidatus Parcubacteria bacterium]|nr:cupredoxin domain-containing protein [Candidatus Parcubacteria bacterium]
MAEPEVLLTSAKSFHAKNAPGISWLLIILFLAFLPLSVMIFGKNQQLVGPIATIDPTPSATAQPRVYTVSYDAGVFSPTNLRIHAGDTVKFKNSSVFPLHVTSSDVIGFDSVGDIPQGSYFVFTFAAKGEFSYHSTRNVDQGGTIIVR